MGRQAATWAGKLTQQKYSKLTPQIGGIVQDCLCKAISYVLNCFNETMILCFVWLFHIDLKLVSEGHPSKY